jgi:probable selenium-dependent hydroxylase accessory protein YqeC
VSIVRAANFVSPNHARNNEETVVIERVAFDGLAAALELSDQGMISLVGGGGKTTALFALGRQLPGTVVLSTTTKMGSDRTGGLVPLMSPDRRELAAAVTRDRVVLCWNGVDGHRALGFAPDVVSGWTALADHVVVEADGSRRMPFKAPAAHEPVVPRATSTLVACVGAAALGRPIRQVCHRAELVAAIAGCGVDDELDAERLARVLLDPAGSGKGRPTDSRLFVLVNQVTDHHRPALERLHELVGDEATLVPVAPFPPEDSPER